MNQAEVNSAAIRLLNNGCSTINLLRIAAHYRRLQLEQSLYSQFNGIVVAGPFKGLKLPQDALGSVLACPKLLGIYKKEIQNDLMKIAGNSRCFMEIGSVEGFYTTGIAIAANVNVAIGVDINEQALALAEKFAIANGVSKKCKFTSNLNDALTWLDGKPLILINSVGAEAELVDQLFSEQENEAISRATFIIETEIKQDGKSNRDDIAMKLEAHGFNIKKEINQSNENRFSSLAGTISQSFLDQCVMGMEGRPLTQSWLIAKPAQKSLFGLRKNRKKH